MDVTPSRGAKEFREQVGVIWRHKWLVLLSIVIITTVATGATMLFSTKQYQSSTEILQQDSGLDQALLGSTMFQNPGDDPQRYMDTAAELVVSPPVNAAVSKELGSKLGGKDPASMVSVSVVNQADILKITATDHNPQLASDVANSYADNYMAWRQQTDNSILQQAEAPIQSQISNMTTDQQGSSAYSDLNNKLQTLKMLQTIQTGNLQLVNKAAPATSPSSPRPVRTGLLAFFSSLVFAFGAVFTVEITDKRIRKADEITTRIDKPILASIPFLRTGDGQLETLSNPAGPAAEAYRILKTNLGYMEPDSEIRSIMISSSEPNDGKSTTIANLAVTLARGGKKVIVIEGDLRRPTLASYLDLNNSAGVTNVISGHASLRESLQMIEARELSNQTSIDNYEADQLFGRLNGTKPIYCVTSGPIPPNPGEMVASEKMSVIIEEAAGYADLVLVDAPPLLAAADATSIAAKVDAAILVVKLDATSKKSLNVINDFISKVPCKVLGIVVTNAAGFNSYKKGYGYYDAYSNR